MQSLNPETIAAIQLGMIVIQGVMTSLLWKVRLEIADVKVIMYRDFVTKRKE